MIMTVYLASLQEHLAGLLSVELVLECRTEDPVELRAGEGEGEVTLL